MWVLRMHYYCMHECFKIVIVLCRCCLGAGPVLHSIEHAASTLMV